MSRDEGQRGSTAERSRAEKGKTLPHSDSTPRSDLIDRILRA